MYRLLVPEVSKHHRLLALEISDNPPSWIRVTEYEIRRKTIVHIRSRNTNFCHTFTFSSIIYVKQNGHSKGS